jgi:hypothetical protein
MRLIAEIQRDPFTGIGKPEPLKGDLVHTTADLSGASEETVRRALVLSKSPVLCTRSAAHALRPHPANLPDELLHRGQHHRGEPSTAKIAGLDG